MTHFNPNQVKCNRKFACDLTLLLELTGALLAAAALVALLILV